MDGGDDGLDDVAVRSLAAAQDMDLRLGIEITPLISQSRQYFGGIALFEQRPVVPAGRAFGQHVDRRVEPDGDRAFVQDLPGARVVERAASGGDYPDLSVYQAGHKAPFSIAEIMFPIALEQLGSLGTGRFLDRDVAINERQTESLREAAPDGGLSCAHQADKHDRPIKKFCQLLHGSGLYIGAQGRAKAFLAPIESVGAAMPRGLIFLIVVILLLVGGLFLLSRSAGEVPVQTIEADVASNAATN